MCYNGTNAYWCHNAAYADQPGLCRRNGPKIFCGTLPPIARCRIFLHRCRRRALRVGPDHLCVCLMPNLDRALRHEPKQHHVAKNQRRLPQCVIADTSEINGLTPPSGLQIEQAVFPKTQVIPLGNRGFCRISPAARPQAAIALLVNCQCWPAWLS